MIFDDDVTACAGIVEKADPDRFSATMALPVPVRAKLFPLWAFNIEVARAPWVTQEPLIAEMRLQWWRDALEEIATDVPARRHEVVTPLARILTPDQARALDGTIEARRWDIHADAFEDEAAMWAYLEATTGTLLWVAAQVAGAQGSDESALRKNARAVALANWFVALPELEARGKRPMYDGRAARLGELATATLDDLRTQRLSSEARQVLLTGWRARKILQRVKKQPHIVADGMIEEGPLARSLSLIRARLTGRI